jgi:hypothetical protein
VVKAKDDRKQREKERERVKRERKKEFVSGIWKALSLFSVRKR